MQKSVQVIQEYTNTQTNLENTEGTNITRLFSCDRPVIKIYKGANHMPLSQWCKPILGAHLSHIPGGNAGGSSGRNIITQHDVNVLISCTHTNRVVMDVLPLFFLWSSTYCSFKTAGQGQQIFLTIYWNMIMPLSRHCIYNNQMIINYYHVIIDYFKFSFKISFREVFC